MAGEKTIYLEHPKSGHIYMSLGPFSGDVINLRTGKERHFGSKDFMKLKRLSIIDALTININVPYFYRSWHAQRQIELDNLAQISKSEDPFYWSCSQSSPKRTPQSQ